MRTPLPLVLSLAFGVACHNKREAPRPAAPTLTSAPGTAGSAADGAPDATRERAAPVSDVLAARYLACWAAFSRSDLDEFASCYAEEARSSWLDERRLKAAFPDGKLAPQWVFVTDSEVAAIGLLSGTQRGPLLGADGVLEPTRKPIGQLVFHDARFGADGRILGEALLLDRVTLFDQLGRWKKGGRPRSTFGLIGAPVVVATRGDATELENLDTIAASWSSFADEDLDGVAATLADDVVLADQTATADRLGKGDVVGSLGGLLGGLKQIHVDCPRRFAAGAYVVSLCEIHATSSTTRLEQNGLPLAFTLAEVVRLEGGLQKEIVRFADMERVTSQLEQRGADAGMVSQGAGGSTSTGPH